MGRDGTSAGPELTVQARGLVARFGDRVALEGFDLDVAPGEIVGLLGPNGAGKTTALRLLATGRRPQAGTLTLFGTPVRPYARTLLRPHARTLLRRRIGIAGDEPVHLEALTGWENAVGFAMAAGLARADAERRVAAHLETFGLAADRDRPVAEYSQGMRRKLLLIEALAHEPALLILDEPTAGLDPDGRAVLARVLAQRVEGGTAVVLATNELSEAERLCHRVVFLRAGRTVLEGRPAELIARLGGAARFEFSLTAERAPEVRVPGVEVVLATPERVVAHAGVGGRGSGDGGHSVLPALCDAIQRTGAVIEAVQVRRPGLADVYLKATGEELVR